jgi:hypothetical protein
VTTLIRGGVPDFIAGAYYHLGYRPQESVILIGLQSRGTKYRTAGPTLRVDIPAAKHARELARQSAGTMAAAGCEAALVVIVTSGDGDILARTLRAALKRAGIRVLEVMQIGDSSYWSLDCHDRRCCPIGGHPLSDIFEGTAAATFIASGAILLDTEEELIADVAVAQPPGAQAVVANRTSEEWLTLWLEGLDQSHPGGEQRLPEGFGEALVDYWLRDSVLLSLSGGSPEDARRLVRNGVIADNCLAGRPDTELLDRGTRLLAEVARTASSAGRLEALAALAWLEWWRGSGARSRLLAAEALGLDPQHRLARLVDSALLGAVAPPWVEEVVPEWLTGTEAG